MTKAHSTRRATLEDTACRVLDKIRLRKRVMTIYAFQSISVGMLAGVPSRSSEDLILLLLYGSFFRGLLVIYGSASFLFGVSGHPTTTMTGGNSLCMLDMYS